MSAPVALFNFANRWMREMILQAAPPEFDVRFIDDPSDDGRVDGLLSQADFLVTIQLPARWIRRLTRCRLVQLQGVGYDGVDLQTLSEVGIPLAQTPEGTTVGVAEHTILLVLALCKRLVEVNESVRRGQFDHLGWRAQCHFFQGRTLGIVGFGRIGRRVAHLARAFEARIIYYDTAPLSHDVGKEAQAEPVEFDRLLERADIVSVHTPLTHDTRRLFGAREFARMKPGALFINTSRGGTCDLDALYEALRSGHLGGAGLDVFDPQPPPPDHPILQLPNVICTPHMAAGTVESHLQKAAAQFENFLRVLRGEPPQHVVSTRALVGEPVPAR